MRVDVMKRRRGFDLLARRNPSLVAAAAYALYMLLGAVLLYLPVLRDAGRNEPVGFVDALFISTSAVSTTGLATLDPGTTFNFAGELTILILIQIGGIGYMTIMSFAYLALRDRLSPIQSRLARSSFGLPDGFRIANFLRNVVIFTLAIEFAGALILWNLFDRSGTPNAAWNGIFHAVSAFCTAGFSLFPTSLEAFKADGGILLTVSILSLLGALGFVVIGEVFEAMFVRRRHLSVTTRLILSVTALLISGATLFLLLFEPSIRTLPVDQAALNAFFQAMTASTTVGFNSVPIGGLTPAAILIVYLLMFVGASPSGTGGGLKSTTAALLAATALASLRGRAEVVAGNYLIPPRRVIQAAGTLVVALLVIGASLILLDLTGDYALDKALFEVVSALGTVGLSMGLTGELNDAGKLIVTAVMYVGRVGILAFFVALALAASDEDELPVRRQDVIL